MNDGKSHIRELIEQNDAAIAYCEKRMREEEDIAILKAIINQLRERRIRLEGRISGAELGTLPQSAQSNMETLT